VQRVLLDAWEEKAVPLGGVRCTRPILVINEAQKLISWSDNHPKQLADLLSSLREGHQASQPLPCAAGHVREPLPGFADHRLVGASGGM
jgi:hypothetical protein